MHTCRHTCRHRYIYTQTQTYTPTHRHTRILRYPCIHIHTYRHTAFPVHRSGTASRSYSSGFPGAERPPNGITPASGNAGRTHACQIPVEMIMCRDGKDGDGPGPASYAPNTKNKYPPAEPPNGDDTGRNEYPLPSMGLCPSSLLGQGPCGSSRPIPWA